MRERRFVCELDTKLCRPRPCHQALPNSDARGTRDLDGEGHDHAGADQERALDMAAMGREPSDRAPSESVLVVHHDGAGNGEEFNIVSGETGLHAATLGERREERHSALDGSGCTGE